MTNTSTGSDLNDRTIEIGDFIHVPAWRTSGMVINTRPAMLGSDDAQEVLLETRCGDPAPRWYRVEPTEFRFDFESDAR